MSYTDTHTIPAQRAAEHGQAVQAVQNVQDVRVRSHLVAAVLVTLFCFAPTGVAAVVWAGNVRTRLAQGDVEGARRASTVVRRLCWVSVAITLGFLLVIVVGAQGYSDTH
jgi:uncharacterized membrane protein